MKQPKKFLLSIIIFQFFNKLHSLTPSKDFNTNEGIFEISRNVDPTTRTRRDTSENDNSDQNSNLKSNSSSDSSAKNSSKIPVELDGDDAPSTKDVGEKQAEIVPDDVESEAKSVPITTPSGPKQLTFIRSQFHKAEGHTHAYINWAGKGSKVIFVLTMKKTSSYHRSSRNGPTTEESFLYRSRNYGKDWYQITAKTAPGFPEGAMLKSYRPSSLKTGCLVFVDDQREGLGDYTTKSTVLDKIYYNHTPAKGRIVVTRNRGETYESNNLPFAIEEFSFHPTEEDWILAYDKKESQLWSSTDLGVSWVQLSDPKTMLVTDKRWFWGVENIDAPNIVHFEYRERGAKTTTYRVYTCNIYRCLKPCTNANDDSDNCKLNDYNELLGEISRDSLAVEGTYILVEKSIGQYTSGPKHLYTSHKRGNFQKAHFTSNEKFNDYHVINAKDDFIVLGVLHSDMSKSNLYVSNKKGDVFWLTLPNINSNHVRTARFSISTSADPFKVDCVTMPSLVGVLMCNQQNTTMISYTSGTEWLKINKPGQVISYIDPKNHEPITTENNKEDSLNLHLSLKFSKSGYYMPKFYSLGDGEYGYAFAHGNYGRTQPAKPHNNQHDQTHMGAYMTNDGGVTWHYILEHRHVFTATDFGRIILARESKSFTEFDNADFSMDYGKTFQNVAITDKKIQIDGILTEPGGHTPYFTIFGHPKTTGNGPNESKTDAWHIITVNATEIFEDRECDEKDYETWPFKVPEETSNDLNAIDTPLGMTRNVKRLKNDTFCVNNDELLEYKKTQEKIANPQCLIHDYTCGYLYNLNQDGECEFDKTLWKTFNDQHDLTWFDEQTERSPMKVPGDECVTDLSWYDEEEFENSNKQHLAGDTGFGRGWDLIVKSHQINKQSLLLTHSCDAQGSNTDMPIGGHITYKVGGKFHKMENTTFKWKKDKFMTPENDDEDGRYEEIKSYEEHGENEWKVTCQSAGMHKISVKMMDKNDNDNVLFEDNVVLNCWSPLNDNFLVFTCVPRVSAGEVVHCRALMTTKEKHGYGLAEDRDSTYKFYNSQLMGPHGTDGISTAGVGKLAAITSFKTPTKTAWVEVAVKNPVCQITRKVKLVIGEPDHLPGSVDNKAIQFQLNGFGLNITSVDSVKHADLLLGSINDDMLKDRSISTPNFIKKAFFPTLMQGRGGKFDKTRTMVVVYLIARDEKVEGKNEEFSRFLQNFKALFDGKYLHDGGEFGNADVNGTQAEGSYKITDIMVVSQEEVEQEVINNSPVSASASSGWLTMFGVFFCLASIAVGIYYGMNFLVNRNHRTYRQPPQHQDPLNLSNSVHNTGTRNNEMRTLDDNDTAGIIDNEELDNPL